MEKKTVLVYFFFLSFFSLAISLKTNFDFASATTLKVPSQSVQFNNTLSPNSSLTICGEKFSSFVWYKIEPLPRLTVISLDTCNSTFDTAIGVYSGTSFDNLKLLACNDDLFTVRAVGECNPYASYIPSVYIPAGETVYFAIGGYLNPNTHIPSHGEGTFNLDYGCFPYLIYEKELTFASLTQIVLLDSKGIGKNISETSSSMISNIDTFRANTVQKLANFQLQLPTQTFQSISEDLSAIDLSSIPSVVARVRNELEIINDAVAPLEDDSQRAAQSLDNFHSNLANEFTALSNRIENISSIYDNYLGIISLHRYQIEDFLNDLNATLIAQRVVIGDSLEDTNNNLIAQHLNIINSVNQKLVQTVNSIQLLKTQLQSTINNINDRMTVLSSKIDHTTSDINDVKSKFTVISNRIVSMNSQLNNINSTMNSMKSNLDLSFQSLSQSCSQILNNLNNAKNVMIDSFPVLSDKIAELDDSAETLKQSTVDTLSLLNAGIFTFAENEMGAVFINTVASYLYDLSIEYPPLHLRIPNKFGGRMDDVLYLIQTRQVLVEQELYKRDNVDTTTFDLYYAPNLEEFISNYHEFVAQMRFKEAYGQLQRAFISLFPEAWFLIILLYYY